MDGIWARDKNNDIPLALSTSRCYSGPEHQHHHVIWLKRVPLLLILGLEEEHSTFEPYSTGLLHQNEGRPNSRVTDIAINQSGRIEMKLRLLPVFPNHLLLAGGPPPPIPSDGYIISALRPS